MPHDVSCCLIPTPTHHNGNYTVLVDGASDEDARDWERIDFMRQCTPTGYYFLVAPGTTYNGVTYDRETWIKREGSAVFLFEALGSRVLKIAQLPRLTGAVQRLFSGCSSLTELKVCRDLDVSGLTRADMWFAGLTLEHLDVSKWDVSSFTSVVSIFQNCENLRELDVSQWDTSHFTTLSQMFYGCKSLTTLDLSGWDTALVTNTYAVFYQCTSLRYITFGAAFFKTKATLQLSGATNLGRDESGNNNGWLQHLVATAPIIREKANYTELLEQEGSQWYLNDGIGRTIQLPTALKNAGWAAPMLNILREHGYTIA